MFFCRMQKKRIAFFLFVALFISQFSGMGMYQSEESSSHQFAKVVSAASVYEDTDAIPMVPGAVATGSAISIEDFTVLDGTTDSISMTWTGVGEGITSYFVYAIKAGDKAYSLVGETKETSFAYENLSPGQKYYFTVCPFDEVNKLQGSFAEPQLSHTTPARVENPYIIENKRTSVAIGWDARPEAWGYEVYYADSSNVYKRAGVTKETSFNITGLQSGKTYRFKVRAYAYNRANVGKCCPVIKMTTLPDTPAVTVKSGEKKVRLRWNAVTGAGGYHIYRYTDGSYQLLTTLQGKSNTEYIHTGLKNNGTYRYKVASYRTLYETEYCSELSAAKTATPSAVKASSTKAKYYKTKKEFKNSAAYKNVEFFRKNVSYEKSMPIPGLLHADIGGFNTTSMCPQGLAFASSYRLVSAYDLNAVEKSVIFVMDKAGKKLLTTVILPNKTHAGGIVYDGKNIWVTQEKTVRSFPFSKISEAVKKKQKYCYVDFVSVCTLTHQAATVTYYKDKLWVASYDELNSGYLSCYTVTDKATVPSLNKVAQTRIATRVQGIAFTSSGKLILSRSCQTNKYQRGFLHQIDSYKPDLSELSSGTILLGQRKKSVQMPTMNEEIAIDGKYLYVNFESGAFKAAVNPVDRICAFKTSVIV